MRTHDSLRLNVFAMMAGQLITWSLTATMIAILPRYLGPERMGQYAIGGSFEMLGVVFAGLGMPILITKETARDRRFGSELMSTAIWLSVALGLVAAALGMVIAVLAGYHPLTLYVIAMATAAIPSGLVIALGFGMFQGVEKMRYQAIIDVSLKLGSLAGLIVIVVLDLGFIPIPAYMLSVSIAIAIATVVWGRQALAFQPFRFSREHARYLIVGSLPFWTMGVFLVLYQATDVLALSRLADATAVGIYATPSRVLGTMLFVPVIITTVAFPRMAFLHRESSDELLQMAKLTLKLVLAASLPVSIVAFGLADDALVGIIGEDFSQSGAVIAALAISLVPTGTSIVANRILAAVDRQRIWTFIMIVAFIAKVLLDLAAIPLFDHWFDNPALGAAVVLVAIESVMMLAALWLMPRGVLDRDMGAFAAKLVLAGAVAIAAMVAWAPLGALAAGFVGAVCYALFAVLIGLFTPAQLIAAFRWGMGRGELALPESLR